VENSVEFDKFWRLGFNLKNQINMICKNKHKIPFCPGLLDITVVGERGQIVIPKKIREALGLTSGSKVMAMQHGEGALILMPVEKMRSLMKGMQQSFNAADKLLKSI
jgi:AbrB family looped-hinge helix DNA binding protein